MSCDAYFENFWQGKVLAELLWSSCGTEFLQLQAAVSGTMAATIRSMLRNEKYMGDVLLQKTYTSDFLSKKKVKNLGKLPLYYVENNHEPIIFRETFQQVQGELLRRGHLYSESGMREAHSCKYALSGRMICSYCGSS